MRVMFNDNNEYDSEYDDFNIIITQQHNKNGITTLNKQIYIVS